MEDDSDYDICVTRFCSASPTDYRLLTTVIEAALRAHNVKTATVSVALVDDARMAELHKRHMDIDGPTDVLTFDLGSVVDSECGDVLVEGDIVLSVETAQRECEHRGTGLGAELALYAVHGTLHLLGYEDGDEAATRKMRVAEDEALTRAGVGGVFGGDR